MKKIYEKPMVELTKFDVEDIITASGTTQTTVDFSNVTTTDKNTNDTIKTQVGGNVGVYNW